MTLDLFPGPRLLPLPLPAIVEVLGRWMPRGGPFPGAWAEPVLSRYRVLIALEPAIEEVQIIFVADSRSNLVESVCWHLGRQGPPAISVPQQDKKVRAWRHLATALDLAQADVHRLLVQAGLLAYPPTQVNCLESSAGQGAEGPQARIDVLMEDVALVLEVGKRGAHKDAEGAGPIQRRQLLIGPIRSRNGGWVGHRRGGLRLGDDLLGSLADRWPWRSFDASGCLEHRRSDVRLRRNRGPTRLGTAPGVACQVVSSELRTPIGELSKHLFERGQIDATGRLFSHRTMPLEELEHDATQVRHRAAPADRSEELLGREAQGHRRGLGHWRLGRWRLGLALGDLALARNGPSSGALEHRRSDVRLRRNRGPTRLGAAPGVACQVVSSELRTPIGELANLLFERGQIDATGRLFSHRTMPLEELEHDATQVRHRAAPAADRSEELLGREAQGHRRGLGHWRLGRWRLGQALGDLALARNGPSSSALEHRRSDVGFRHQRRPPRLGTAPGLSCQGLVAERLCQFAPFKPLTNGPGQRRQVELGGDLHGRLRVPLQQRLQDLAERGDTGLAANKRCDQLSRGGTDRQVAGSRHHDHPIRSKTYSLPPESVQHIARLVASMSQDSMNPTPMNLDSSRAEAASHTIIVSSLPPDIASLPSCENPQQATSPSWPERVETAAPLSASQMRKVLSLLPETIRLPSGETAQDVTRSMMS